MCRVSFLFPAKRRKNCHVCLVQSSTTQKVKADGLFFFLFPHIAAAFAAACSAVHRAERALATFLHFTYPSSVAIETCLYHRPFVPILQQCGPILSLREGQDRALQFRINGTPTGAAALGTFVPATPGAPGYCSAHTHTSARTYTEPGAHRYILQVWPGGDIHATWRYRSPQPCRGARAGCGTGFALHFQLLAFSLSIIPPAALTPPPPSIIHIINNAHNNPVALH